MLAEKARGEVVDAEERVRTYAESVMEQKADEIQISISTVTGTLTTDIQDTKDDVRKQVGTFRNPGGALSQRVVSDQEDALLDYKHETRLISGSMPTGSILAKQEDGDESPYSIKSITKRWPSCKWE